MNDNDFRELQLKSICPNADEWPTEYKHQQALVAAVNEAHAFLRDADAKLDAIDANHDLSPEGKQRQRAERASKSIIKLQTSKALTCAREASEHVLQNYEAKIASKLPPATDAQSIGVHAQIRDQLHRMQDPKERMSFFERNGSDLTLISAALSAPAYVSCLTDAEVALLQKNLMSTRRPRSSRSATSCTRHWPKSSAVFALLRPGSPNVAAWRKCRMEGGVGLDMGVLQLETANELAFRISAQARAIYGVPPFLGRELKHFCRSRKLRNFSDN